MGFLVIFIGIFCAGVVIAQVLKKEVSMPFLPPYIFLLGSFISIPLLYYARVYIFSNLFIAANAWLMFIVLVYVYVLRTDFSIFKQTWRQKKYICVFIVLTAASYYLFNKCFTYRNSDFLIATNMYLDMGAHIPFIRSFSTDINFPFQIPFYFPSNIPYHYMFNFYTGVLEYGHMRIDIAYNLLSALTLSSLLFIFLDHARALFKRASVGLLAFVFFLLPFNYHFFTVLGGGILNLWRNQQYNFSSFLGENTAGNFLYINTYLNQRHLLFSLSLTLILMTYAYGIVAGQSRKDKRSLFILGGMLSLMYLWNMSVFIMIMVCFSMILILFRRKKQMFIIIMTALALGVLQAAPYVSSSTAHIKFSPGFLVHLIFSPLNLSMLWICNLGIGVLTILGGFLISNSFQRKIFFVLQPVFILPNLFQFTNDMFDNHKFFNFWFMFMCFYSAFYIYTLYKKGKVYQAFAIIIFCLSVVTAFTNIAVVKNDIYEQIPDYKKYTMMKSLAKEKYKHSTFLTNGEIYDPASISGLKTFIGRSHYIYLYGGDPNMRILQRQSVFNAKSLDELKAAVKLLPVDYIIIYKDPGIKNMLHVYPDIIKEGYEKVYEDNFGIIYKI